MKTIVINILFLMLFVLTGSNYVKGEDSEIKKIHEDKVQLKHEGYKMYFVAYELTKEKSVYKRLYNELKNTHGYRITSKHVG